MRLHNVINAINYPNSLVARVLKAKYYPNTDFNNAQLGNIPSLTWKSVSAAKGLLNNGLCWRVGKGNGISIWEDRFPAEIAQQIIRFLLRKCLITTFKCGRENRPENSLPEAPTNYYKKLALILVIIIYRPTQRICTKNFGI